MLLRVSFFRGLFSGFFNCLLDRLFDRLFRRQGRELQFGLGRRGRHGGRVLNRLLGRRPRRLFDGLFERLGRLRLGHDLLLLRAGRRLRRLHVGRDRQRFELDHDQRRICHLLGFGVPPRDRDCRRGDMNAERQRDTNRPPPRIPRTRHDDGFADGFHNSRC